MLHLRGIGSRRQDFLYKSLHSSDGLFSRQMHERCFSGCGRKRTNDSDFLFSQILILFSFAVDIENRFITIWT